MTQSVIKMIAMCSYILMLMTSTTHAQGPRPEGPNSQEQLMREIRNLRLELVQQALEFQAWKIQEMERDLKRAQKVQQSLGEEENAINQQVLALSDAAAVEADRTSELEAIRAELIGNDIMKVQAVRQEAEKKAAQLTEQLDREKRRLDELSKRAEKLRAAN